MSAFVLITRGTMKRPTTTLHREGCGHVARSRDHFTEGTFTRTLDHREAAKWLEDRETAGRHKMNVCGTCKPESAFSADDILDIWASHAKGI